MAPVAVGVLALLLILLVVRGLAYADAKVLFRILRYFGAAGLGCNGFAGADRPSGACPISWEHGMGIRDGWTCLARRMATFFRWTQSSSVHVRRIEFDRTNWVEMQLDHETGAMNGMVLKGPHAGDAARSDRSRGDSGALWRSGSGQDQESARLIEAYLDRRFGSEWRSEPAENTASPRRETMSRDEAFKILGLKEGATEEEIRNAHRRLMMQIHPDRGGSDYLAAKINQARDILLGN